MSRTRKELKSSKPMSAEVKMYTTRFCPYCVRARSLLANKNVKFIDIAVDSEPDLRREMVELSGRYTVPQIWIGSKHIGGYDDIAMLERQGQLDQILQAA
jgi:glutaredoxin 3